MRSCCVIRKNHYSLEIYNNAVPVWQDYSVKLSSEELLKHVILSHSLIQNSKHGEVLGCIVASFLVMNRSSSMSHQPYSSISTSKNGAGSVMEATTPSRASSATSGWATDEDTTQYTMAELGLSSRARNCGECPLCLLLAEQDVLSTLLAGEFIYISSVEGMEQSMMSKRKKLCEFYRCILERLKTVPVRTETEWAGGKSNRLLTPILNSRTGIENEPFTREKNSYFYGPICACMIVHRGDDMKLHSGLCYLKFTIRHPQADMIAADPRKSTQYNVKFSDLTIDIFALRGIEIHIQLNSFDC